ncbi:MAG: hypothetical protein D3906_08135 [Candidatus Electrothrix sp. AUS1_2]|nr:hypothetical protein [Candidatus Electrothrix sp. AUS1_2]
MKLIGLKMVMFFSLLIAAGGTAFAHTHYGNLNESVTPQQVAPGDTVTVAFDYAIWHSHCSGSSSCDVDTGWRIYLDDNLAASGVEVHSAHNETITYNISEDIVIPADMSTGYHTVKIVTCVDNSSWGVTSYTRTTTLPLEVIYIDAGIDITPDVLKLKSNGNWVTTYISLPTNYDINDIDVASVRLEGTIPVVRSDIQGDVLMVKFSRSELQSLIDSMAGEPNEVELSVTGNVSSMKFKGTDIIGVNY